MPRFQRWMGSVPLSQSPHQLCCFTPKIDTVGAIVLAGTMTESRSFTRNRQHVGIETAHPCRWGGRCCRQVHSNTILRTHIPDVIQLTELIVLRRWLK